MIVSVGELDCLDLIVWLRTGENAASRLSLSQPAISRNARKASDQLGISLEKAGGEWEVLGDQTLLSLARRVHQEYRWSSDSALRIEAQYYSGALFCDPPPEGWMVGNFDYLETRTPLQHLRTGVIDAWIGCYPDVPDPDDPELSVFHLTRLPTHLVVSAGHPLLEIGREITLEDVRLYPSLALPDGAFPKVQAALQQLGLWNLPLNLHRYSHQSWEGKVESDLVIGYATAFSISLFQAPQVVLPIQIPLEVGDSLIVRRDYAKHPRLLKLLGYLRFRAAKLAQQYPEVVIPDP